MHPRFHAPDASAERDQVVLSTEETHHLARVMRLGAGAEVRVFDGRGGEWRARVAAVERRGATVALLEAVEPAAPELPLRVTIAQAVLKGDRMDAVVRDATMLGAAALQPLVTAHTTVPARWIEDPASVVRWRRVAIASCKQCGRAVVPDVAAPLTGRDLRAEALPAARVVLVEPRSATAPLETIDDLAPAARAGGAVAAIGPEGGWSRDELAWFVDAMGFRPWSLGSLTLRADAVVVAAMALMRYAWR